jgi:hypothetical protein
VSTEKIEVRLLLSFVCSVLSVVNMFLVVFVVDLLSGIKE